MAYLSWILAWFEALSGLKVNLDKSSLLPVGRVENEESFALELGCKIGSGMGLKRGSVKGWLNGKDNTSLKVEDSP